MKKFIFACSFLLVSLFSHYANAIETVYAFDTVTTIDLSYGAASNTTHDQSIILGIEKDTGEVLNASFYPRQNISAQYEFNRCIPIILTAMEKPGKYNFYITLDTVGDYPQK